MMSEAAILNAVRLAASQAGFVLWRNNTGQAWAGEATKLQDGSVLIQNPRPLHAGLCKGSADLIGLRPIVITPDMVGQTIAQFVAIEVKNRRGRVSPEQAHFIAAVNAHGGDARIVRGAEEVV